MNRQSSLHNPQSAQLSGGVAVVLQSSLLGFFTHAGFINSLLDSGIRPIKVSGSSAGALTASAFASGLEGDRLRDFVLNPKLQGAFREWGMFWRGPAVFGAYRGSGLLTGKRVVKHLRESLPVKLIQDTPSAELSIGVTNLNQNKKQVIFRGDMAAYIVASCAISPIIRAQEIDGEFYLDGGFTDEAPLDQWIDDDEIDTIIVHRIVSEERAPMKWANKTSFLACWISSHKQVADELMGIRVERARAAGKQVVVHETRVPRSKLIVSQKEAQSKYDCGYQTWQSSPSLLISD